MKPKKKNNRTDDSSTSRRVRCKTTVCFHKFNKLHMCSRGDELIQRATDQVVTPCNDSYVFDSVVSDDADVKSWIVGK